LRPRASMVVTRTSAGDLFGFSVVIIGDTLIGRP
jgi:hypothetical protein